MLAYVKLFQFIILGESKIIILLLECVKTWLELVLMTRLFKWSSSQDFEHSPYFVSCDQCLQAFGHRPQRQSCWCLRGLTLSWNVVREALFLACGPLRLFTLWGYWQRRQRFRIPPLGMRDNNDKYPKDRQTFHRLQSFDTLQATRVPSRKSTLAFTTEPPNCLYLWPCWYKKGRELCWHTLGF